MKEKILSNKTYLGIEFGSTRIKACLIDDTFTPIASGSFDWENKLEGGYWTYDIDEIHKGLKSCYADLKADVLKKYGVKLTSFGAIGISGMMHGYLPFDKDGKLLAPFRTWRNTTTEKAAGILSDLFDFSIPQRWSIAHLYQAILNGEEHVKDISYILTLAGYIHYLLTGDRVLGMGEASGMFPVKDGAYDEAMLDKFSSLPEVKAYPWDIRNLLPLAESAGEKSSFLTKEGALFLDSEGDLAAGIPLCPPEGDADTGMVATNSVTKKTGNISAGTSIFAMLVLSESLSHRYDEIDILTTPDGSPVAMVHCNNCCGEIDAWVKLFMEFSTLMGKEIDKSEVYKSLYENALKGDADAGKIGAFNYLSGEHLTKTETGHPMYFRSHDSDMNLSNFIRAQLYSCFATLRLGMNILTEKENVKIDKIQAHGGLFKVKGVAQKFLSDALSSPVSVTDSAGEGGAFGMSLLAAYMMEGEGLSLGDWLDEKVFSKAETYTITPEKEGTVGFNAYMERYKKALDAEKALENI